MFVGLSRERPRTNADTRGLTRSRGATALPARRDARNQGLFFDDNLGMLRDRNVPRSPPSHSAHGEPQPARRPRSSVRVRVSPR